MISPQHPLTPAAMSAWRAFLEVSARIMPRIEAQLQADGGITHAQYGVLLALQAEPHGLTMTQIARAMVVSKSGLTYQIDRLVDSGLVTRAVDPDDERRRVVRITRAGLDALAAVRPGHVAIIAEHFVGALAAGEVEALASALIGINDHLGSVDDHT
jgi:DNA-binding MarR family transcriptional regulator